MSAVRLLAAGLSDAARAEALRDDPDFRRATGNVRLAASAVEAALAKLSVPLSVAGSRAALVVATGHGELEPTAGFLQELGRSNVARPLLFQNSLHNTTAGFLAQRLRLEGPVMTVSDGVFSGEDAVDIASTLLESDADIALVVAVDSFPPVLEALLPSLYPSGFRPADRAAAILLVKAAGETRFANGSALWRALWIDDLQRQFEHRPLSSMPEGFFDSNAVALLAEAALGPPSSGARTLQRQTPDGSGSRMHLRWEP